MTVTVTGADIADVCGQLRIPQPEAWGGIIITWRRDPEFTASGIQSHLCGAIVDARGTPFVQAP